MRTTVVIKSGHMLGTPVNPPLLATNSVAVTMRAVREISRKDSNDCSSRILRDYTPDTVVPSRDEIVRSSRRREERDRNDRVPDLFRSAVTTTNGPKVAKFLVG